MMRLLYAVLFAVAHTQPLGYFSNQNQYYLHGLAAAGYGDLQTDWLANTADPTPVFSWLVQHGFANGVMFFALLMVYFLSLLSIADTLPRKPSTSTLALVLIVLHSAALRVASVALFGVDYPWYLQCGVANQYVLGPGLQPSVFGVLLITSIAAYLHGYHALSGLLLATTCWFHCTYLLSAALFTLALMMPLPRRERFRFGLLTLLTVLPVVIWVVLTFVLSGHPKDNELAAHYLAHVRIPHHTEPRRWLDIVTGLQIIFVVVSIILSHGRLRIILAYSFGLALGTSVYATFVKNDLQVLMFPWRVSTVLMPIATTVIVARVLTSLQCERRDLLPQPRRLRSAIVMVVVALTSAVLVYGYHLGYRESAAEAVLIDHVRATRQPGELYLLPAGFPPPPKSRGSYSSTFLPPGTQVNPFELQRFRLGSGAKEYVDFKSIPYRDDEVLEWHRRLNNCVEWYKQKNWDTVVPLLQKEGITHVIAPAKAVMESMRLSKVYDDGKYAIYLIL